MNAPNEANVQTDDTQEDPIRQHYVNIAQSAALLKSRLEKAKKDPNKPVTVGALAAIIEGDLFPFLLRTVEIQGQFRDNVARAFETMDERIDAAGLDGTSISEDDAPVFRGLIIAVRELVGILRAAGTAAVVEAKLVEFEALATRAEAILDESSVTDEEDEGEEGDDGDDEEEG